MSYNIVNLECPGCATPLSPDMKNCPSCGRKLYISSMEAVKNESLPGINKALSGYSKALAGSPDDPNLNTSAAFCYLKLKLYDKAIACFEKAMENCFDNSEIYYGCAIALLKGKSPFDAGMASVKKAEEYLNAAYATEVKGIYRYLLAYLKHDFYERKYLRSQPTSKVCIEEALGLGVTAAEIDELHTYLGTANPKLI